MPYRDNLVVVGSGGIGVAIARRLGIGHHIFLADSSEASVNQAAASLRSSGHDVETHVLDVSDFTAVTTLATRASASGELRTVVNTAGISVTAADARRVYEVNLLGTVNILDAFLDVMPPGSTLTSIASLAGHLTRPTISAELEEHLAYAPRTKVLQHNAIDLDATGTSAESSYGISKWGNIVRIQAAAKGAGARGVRVNSVSPGVIATPMIMPAIEKESQETGGFIRDMIEATPMQRIGTPDDVASAVAFLASSEASFITGMDLLIDGGYASSQRLKQE